jgi:transcriptional activator Myb
MSDGSFVILYFQEDETIIQMVNKLGPKKWSTIAQTLPGRIGKQCRERYG